MGHGVNLSKSRIRVPLGRDTKVDAEVRVADGGAVLQVVEERESEAVAQAAHALQENQAAEWCISR